MQWNIVCRVELYFFFIFFLLNYIRYFCFDVNIWLLFYYFHSTHHCYRIAFKKTEENTHLQQKRSKRSSVLPQSADGRKNWKKTILKNSTMLSMLNVYINCDRFIIKENNTNFQKILIFNGMTSNVIKFMFFFPSLRNSFYSQSDRIEMSFTFTYDCSCSMRAVWHIQNNHFLLVGILFSKIKWNICLGNVPVR